MFSVSFENVFVNSSQYSSKIRKRNMLILRELSRFPKMFCLGLLYTVQQIHTNEKHHTKHELNRITRGNTCTAT